MAKQLSGMSKFGYPAAWDNVEKVKKEPKIKKHGKRSKKSSKNLVGAYYSFLDSKLAKKKKETSKFTKEKMINTNEVPKESKISTVKRYYGYYKGYKEKQKQKDLLKQEERLRKASFIDQLSRAKSAQEKLVKPENKNVGITLGKYAK